MVNMFNRKRNKKETTSSNAAIEKFLVRAQYWLDYLEKRIAVYQNKLRRLDRIIRIAAKKKDKDLIIESLKAKRTIKSNLNMYMGMFRNIQLLINKMETAQLVKESAKVLEEGRTIIDKLSSDMPPEKMIEVMEGIRESLTSINEAAEIASEPITDVTLEELDEEELEAEADKIIAEQTLPKVKQEEKKEEEIEEKDLEKELRDILESEE